MIKIDAPEGWEIENIDNLLESDSTGIWGCEGDINTGLAVLRSTNYTKKGTISFDQIAYRIIPENKIQEKKLKAGDILLERSGGGPQQPVGRVAYFNSDEGYYTYGNFIQRLRPNLNKVIPKYLFYKLYHIHQIGITKRFQQATTGLRNLMYRHYLNIEFPLPPLPEQQKIASILSNIDKQITQTEAIIDQTQRLKQGLLQQLLTRGIGHTRFKRSDIGEIPEYWDVVQLGEVFTHRKESGISGLPVMSVTMNNGLVERHTLDRRVASELPSEKHLRVYKGDLVYNMMRMWQGASGVAWDDCIVSPAYVVCKPSDLILPRFSAHFFKAPATIRKLHQHSQGITEDRLRLYFQHFAQIEIGLPPIREQEQIADVLDSIDIEVTSLTKELNSLQRIKQALMENLLTGRVRVKINDEGNTT